MFNCIKISRTWLYLICIFIIVLLFSINSSADEVESLQILINNNAANGTYTIITHDYSSANGKIISLPNNTMIEGNGFNLKNISLYVNNSSNIYINNVLFQNTVHLHNWWEENTFPMINIRGTCNNISVAKCVINSIRTGSVGIYIYPTNISNVSIIDTIVNNTDDHGYMIFSDSPNFKIHNVYFINDSANQNGLYERQNDWPVGFDLGEIQPTDVGNTLQITNMLVDNCSASYNWESGFHIEHGIFTQNVTIQNCRSSYNGQKPVPDYGAGFTLTSAVQAKKNVANSNYIGYYIFNGIIANNATTDRSINLYNNTDANNRLYGFYISGYPTKYLSTSSINIYDHYSQNAGSLGAFVYQIRNMTFNNVSIINPKSTNNYSVQFLHLYNSTINMNYANKNTNSSVGVLFQNSANDTLSGNYYHAGDTAIQVQSIDTHSKALPIINIINANVTSQKYGVQVSNITFSPLVNMNNVHLFYCD